VSAAILLDAGPLGLLTNPNPNPQPTACRAWLASLLAAGRRVIVPEITDYEIRRELIRIKSQSALANLDAYAAQVEYLPLTTAAMRLAADLWAQARATGRQTAPDHALDGDVILAAQALSLNTRRRRYRQPRPPHALRPRRAVVQRHALTALALVTSARVGHAAPQGSSSRRESYFAGVPAAPPRANHHSLRLTPPWRLPSAPPP
jgi:predicted nucleic acid-binding protein